MAKITTKTENMSVTSAINTALIRGEKNIVATSGEHFVKHAFICLSTTDVNLDGNNCCIFGSIAQNIN